MELHAQAFLFNRLVFNVLVPKTSSSAVTLVCPIPGLSVDLLISSGLSWCMAFPLRRCWRHIRLWCSRTYFPCFLAAVLLFQKTGERQKIVNIFARSHRITSCLEGVHLFSLCRPLRDTRLLEVFPGTVQLQQKWSLFSHTRSQESKISKCDTPRFKVGGTRTTI